MSGTEVCGRESVGRGATALRRERGKQLQEGSWRVLQKGGSGGVINEGPPGWKTFQTDHIQSSGEVNTPAGGLALALAENTPLMLVTSKSLKRGSHLPFQGNVGCFSNFVRAAVVCTAPTFNV